MIDALALAVAHVRLAAPDGVRVESGLTVDAAMSLPLAVVSTSTPASVRNGPLEASSSFAIAVSVYADERAQAAALAAATFTQALALWRSSTSTRHGWISRITNDSRHPVHVRSDLEAGDTYRVDFALDVIARN